jgi:hypothetical protein
MKKALLALVALTLVLAVAGSVLGCNNGTTTKKNSSSSSPGPSNSPGQETSWLDDYTVVEFTETDINDAKTQIILPSDGMDGMEGPTMDEFKAAKYLAFSLTNKPANTYDGFQTVWQGDGNSYGWPQVDVSGYDDTAHGFSFKEENGKWLLIELSKALGDYTDKFLSDGNTKAKLIIGFYSTSWDDLGIKDIVLLIE